MCSNGVLGLIDVLNMGITFDGKRWLALVSFAVFGIEDESKYFGLLDEV